VQAALLALLEFGDLMRDDGNAPSAAYYERQMLAIGDAFLMSGIAQSWR
jgi:hypothetical protein